jgi:hypothetical protein
MLFGELRIKNLENFHNKSLEQDDVIIVAGKSTGDKSFFADNIIIQDNLIKLKKKDLEKI